MTLRISFALAPMILVALAASPACTPARSPARPAAQHPADILDLRRWKLQLPIGEPEKPTEVKQPELATFTLAPYFELAPDGRGVLFRVHAGGVTTHGSNYPRTELREMGETGREKAAWSTTSGRHTLSLTVAIQRLPPRKPHVVVAQIHDATDDVVMVRLERERLFLQASGEELVVFTRNYRLGDLFTVRIVAEGGHILAYYGDSPSPAYDYEKVASDCYFKAGAYLQSNTTKGDAESAIGEVLLQSVQVSHQ